MCHVTIKPVNLTDYGSDELISQINLFLNEINMPQNIKGRKYLLNAIKKVYLVPEAINHVISGLYAEISAENGTTVSCVEKDIRTAISIVWNHKDTKILDDYFERSLHNIDTKPTPKEFIALVADKLRRNLIHF